MLQVPIYYLIASNCLLVLAAVVINRWMCKHAAEEGEIHGRILAEHEKYSRGWRAGVEYGKQSEKRLSVLEQRLKDIRANQYAPYRF